MNATTLDLVETTASSRSAAAPSAPRMDIYTTIHKALRHFMCDTLLRVGRLDGSDGAEDIETLEQLGGLLALLRAHVAHEDGHVHVAIEQRRPGAVQRVRGDHQEHLATIDELEAQARELRALPAAGRDAAALRLYRHLALFVAENFEHMHVEETSNNALLWALYSDSEIGALHDRLLASVPMPEMTVVWRWMASALSVRELAAMLGAMQAGMPAKVFQGVLDLMQPHLGSARWSRLAALLGVPQVPGLVAFG